MCLVGLTSGGECWFAGCLPQSFRISRCACGTAFATVKRKAAISSLSDNCLPYRSADRQERRPADCCDDAACATWTPEYTPCGDPPC